MTGTTARSGRGRLRRFLGAVAAVTTGLLAATMLVSPSSAVTAGVVTAPASPDAPVTATSRFLTGWFPYWYGNAELDRILAHPDLTGELMPFWLYSRYTATMRAPVCVHDGSDVKAVECARTTITSAQRAQLARMKQAGLTVLPSFTDDGSAGRLATVLKVPATRTALVTAQVAFVVRNGFDGLDLDYEGFAYRDGQSSWAATRPAWVAYVTELAAALHARRLKLSVTVPVGEPVRAWDGSALDGAGYSVYAWADIAGVIDRLRLMTYDYSWDSAGPIGPAEWVDRVAAAAVEQVGTANARKVWLGIAAYGYDWRVSSTCRAPQRSRKYTEYPAQAWSVYVTARAAKTLVRLPGQTTAGYHWDSSAGEYTFSYRQPDVDGSTGKACVNTRVVWFQDGASHVARALVAAKYHLAGVAMWAFGDETASTWSRLTAAAPSVAPYRPTVKLVVPSLVDAGQTVRADATVAVPGGPALPRASVALQWRPADGGPWRTLASTLTGADGVAHFATRSQRTGSWRAVVPAARGRLEGRSGTPATAVRQAVTLTLTSTGLRSGVRALAPRVVPPALAAVVGRGSATRVAGSVRPFVPGQGVSLFRRSPLGAWVRLATVSVGTSGRYTFLLPTRLRGASTYRVASSGSTSYASGVSSSLALTVR